MADAADASRRAKKREVTDEGSKADIDDAAIQAASYALELMSGTHGTRLFCLGFILKDDKVTPWYYDASGAVCADNSISMIHDFPKFAAFVVTLARLSPERHGALSTSGHKIRFTPKSVPTFPYPTLKGCRVLFDRQTEDGSGTKPVYVTLGDRIFTQYCLVGRRTFLYAAGFKNGSHGKANAVIKFSYQPVAREQEKDLVATALAFGVQHLPELYMAGDLWDMKDSVRAAFFDTFDPTLSIGARSLRAIVYRRYRPLKELFSHSRKCLLLPVMVDQLIDGKNLSERS